MTPLWLLAGLVAVSAAAGVVEWLKVRRRRRLLRAMARSWQMHYTPSDRFGLARRIGLHLPVPGAAAIRVGDLVYGLRGECYRYVFSAEYSVGTIGSPRRAMTVAAFVESRDGPPDRPIELHVAPANRPLIEQYEHLRSIAAGDGGAGAAESPAAMSQTGSPPTAPG